MTIELINVKDHGPPNEIKEFFDNNIPATYSLSTYSQFLVYYHKHCFLAVEGRIIGAILAEARDNCGYIALLAVDPNYQNQRVATKLLFACIDSFLNSCTFVFLETPTNNIASIRLYEKFGFDKVKKISNFYKNGDDAYQFRLSLTPGVGEAKESIIDRAYDDLHRGNTLE